MKRISFEEGDLRVNCTANIGDRVIIGLKQVIRVSTTRNIYRLSKRSFLVVSEYFEMSIAIHEAHTWDNLTRLDRNDILSMQEPSQKIKIILLKLNIPLTGIQNKRISA